MLVTVLLLEFQSLESCYGPPSVEEAPETIFAPIDHYFEPLNEH